MGEAMHRNWRFIAVAGVFGLIAGCGGGEEEKFTLVPVAGKVTLDGKPLPGVTITIIANGSNKPATDGGDVTGGDGSFSAKYRNRSGLAVGKYKVVIARPLESTQKTGALPSEITQSPYMAGLAAEAAAKQKGKAAKPWPYSDGATTPLTHDVSPKGDPDLSFDLKSSLK